MFIQATGERVVVPLPVASPGFQFLWPVAVKTWLFR